MKLLRRATLLALILTAGLPACTPPPPDPMHSLPSRLPHAAVPASTPDGLASLHLTVQMLFDKPAGTRPVGPIAVQRLTAQDLARAPDGSAWRLGHSTLLFKLDSRFWLTDPVFSRRSSPVDWLGPLRFHAPPIALDELPPLAAVLLSHDHYDHLDEPTIRALAHRAEVFVAPLGVGELLVDWGVPASRVRELAWWEHTTVAGLRLTATPARHFSGRGLFDRNRRLWCSWVIESPQLKLFFGGDSGYFDGFREIGARLGPFDVSFLEAGAYDRRWPEVHMTPEQTVQAHRDLGARRLVPIHNGTFDLAFHRWDEPLERVSREAHARGVELLTPRFGARLDLVAPEPTEAWWRSPEAEAAARPAVANTSTAPAD
ncbi:MBL fold metallo-hydrolase [Rubrivivax gelatinosus]|uniref:L-ascorbate metabolism protein UlaG (Beta-lactamase superfamily) n=1 Tax=Rubrivivax gelatinosus TaxID=28068 RepID=A0A4R2MCI8_RUBGE|nr:L-ascorbate metabolism protein UlaG (beta-lactamase superfamily) [Rubrivivax gelatinosus]